MHKSLATAAVALVLAATGAHAAGSRTGNVGFSYGGFASRYNDERRLEEERRRAFLEAVAQRKAKREAASRTTSQKPATPKASTQRVAEPTAKSTKQKGSVAVSTPAKSSPVSEPAAASTPLKAEPPVAQATEPFAAAPVSKPSFVPAKPSTGQPVRTCQRFLPSVGVMAEGACDD